MQTRQTRKSGFTLLELLTTITVIAILVVVGMSVFGTLRQKARSTVSANNLRQWGQALTLYVTESSGAIPYEGSADRVTWAVIANPVNQTSWFNVLPPYVGNAPMRDLANTQSRQEYTSVRGIHSCPLVEWRDHRVPNFSYMMNSQLYNPEGPSNSPDRPIRITQIAEPNATVMFADLKQDISDRPRGRGNHVDDRQPGGKTHIVFFDGSLQSYDAEYVRTETFADSTGSYTDNNKPDVIWNPWIHPRTAAR